MNAPLDLECDRKRVAKRLAYEFLAAYRSGNVVAVGEATSGRVSGPAHRPIARRAGAHGRKGGA